MLKLKLKPEALNDIEGIYEFTFANWGIRQAEKYQDELFEWMSRIIDNPQIGSVYYFSTGNYRKTQINKHLIFYRIEDNEEILHLELSLYLEDKQSFFVEWGEKYISTLVREVPDEYRFYRLNIDINKDSMNEFGEESRDFSIQELTELF